MTFTPDANSSEANQLERSLRKVQQEVLRMGTLVEQSFRLSHQSLFEADLDAIPKLLVLEKQIDIYYRQIESDCATLMTLQAPVAQDLRMLSAFIQLVRDLERIGDYAQDLSEMAVKLIKYPPQSILPEIAQMSEHAQLMLATSLVALADLDGSSGGRVKEYDDIVDDAHDRIYNAIAMQKNVPGVVEPVLLLGLIIRHLERMADHATNISQRVTYIVTGKRN
ncbi:phosphate transport system regulatory protein PhoU [Pleurocapsa sp. CCALA 161]|uniref:phosphate signaling complex protein PhoU n=1 Tax=Pleurocapsa sp. CCALA 161 TaxID=2107688 RepID=UPI000D082388|nr:phosphate signaling complex protein PhoU [Pleurocapsa sp. CCALA 161]PSB10427.1 phosphate transport system regulatory protein PhoU [Pleurocapsa sp. CCALA 161]